jgi:hypothetical protein
MIENDHIFNVTKSAFANSSKELVIALMNVGKV